MFHVACRRSNTASLDVLITDENDNAPEFLQDMYSGGELHAAIKNICDSTMS